MTSLLSLRLHYTATAPLPVERYSGSTWRSGFGAKLRELACVTGASTCDGCPVRHNCAYGAVFDTVQPLEAATSAHSSLNARHHEQPHPYLLSPHRIDERSAIVDFTIVAPAAAHLPLMLRALRRLRPTNKLDGEWHLQAITERTGVQPDCDHPVWTTGQNWPRLALKNPECPPAPQAVRVSLEHPLRLRIKGQYLSPESFSFEAMLAALLRRIQMLNGLAPAETSPIDFHALVSNSKALPMRDVQLQWQDWSRYSSRQKQSIPMGGIVGSFELHGDLAAVWPHLWLGQWLHVGKGAVMGLGRYRLDALV